MSDTMIFTSNDTLPQSLLLGMAFSGTDVIIGDDGYQRFLKTRGSTLKPGMDGSYVTINAENGIWEIGTDFGGYSRLYYYEHGDYWAISNSFYDLSEHLSANQFPMSAYLPGAGGMRISGALGQQPLSDRTPIEEIRLLPRSQMIRICPQAERGQFQRVPAPHDAEGLDNREASYEDGVRRYIKTWIGRYVTILNSDIHLTCDVTGGLDSRTNLALLLRAAKVADVDLASTVHFNSNSGLKRDRMISEMIAKHFNFPIGLASTKDYRRIDLHESYRIWKSHYLHSYWPVYFPTVVRSDKHFWTGGFGGGAHRWVTVIGGAQTVTKALERKRDAFPIADQFDGLISDVEACISELTADKNQPQNSIVCHFRNFRERFHHGRRSQHINSLSPLAGAGLSAVSRNVQEDFLKTQRIFADVIFNSTPDLLGFEFERGYENFAGKTPELLVNLGIEDSHIESSGRAFHSGNDATTGRCKFVEELEMLREEFELSVPSALETNMVSNSDIALARHVLSTAAEVQRFNHRADAKPAATTILAAAVARWT